MIDREALEKHLTMRMGSDAGPEAKAFLGECIDLFCKEFDERGWPNEMPNFVVLPPATTPKDPLGQRGYAGWKGDTDDAAVLWGKGAYGTFAPVEKNADGEFIW